jgi:hypothetical protein
MKKNAIIITAALFSAVALSAKASHAQSVPAAKSSIAVNVGMLQPIVLGGANIEADFRRGHLIVGYSHGWSLDFEGSTVVGDMRKQNISMHLPYTTGVGIGYLQTVASLRSMFDVRFEAKLHRFEVSYRSMDGASRTAIANYSTVTLGAGAYWTLVPFGNRSDAWRGLNISTSVRFWPNVRSTLSGNQIEYSNATTGQMEIHRTANIGIANTPVVVNVSVGYIFH